MKMVDEEKHFSWCSFLLHLPLLFFLVLVISFVAFLYFFSSYGLSSLLVTMSILFISTFVFVLRFFKKKARDYSVDPSQKEGDNDDAANGDDDDDDDDDYDEDEDGLIEIRLVSEEAETIEAMRNINQSRQIVRVDDEDEQEEIYDVNMEDDNLIEIDISIGSIKRRSK